MKLTGCAAASLSGFVLFSLFPSLAQNALQTFHRMQNAIGGEAKIAAIRDLEESVRAQAWHANGTPMGEVHKRTRWIKPNLLRLDQVGAGDTYVLFFNGASGWEIPPNGSLTELAGGELEFAKQYLTGFDLNVWLADGDPKYAISSRGPGRVAISNKDDSNRAQLFILDAKTFLPVKWFTISLADPSPPVTTETRMEDWQIRNGVKFPHRIVKLEGVQKLAEIIVEEIKLNRGLKADELSLKPLDGKPPPPYPATN